MKKRDGLENKQRRDILNRVPRIVLGVLFIVLGILCFTNAEAFSRFLKWVSVFFFGVLFFLMGVSLMGLGIYLIAVPREKEKKIKIPWVDIVCGVLAFFSLSVLFSAIDSFSKTTVDTFTSDFFAQLSKASPNGYYIELPEHISLVGGGFLPTLFVSFGNSMGMGLLGTRIIFGIILTFSLLVLLRHPALLLSKAIVRIRREHARNNFIIPDVERKDENAEKKVTAPVETKTEEETVSASKPTVSETVEKKSNGNFNPAEAQASSVKTVEQVSVGPIFGSVSSDDDYSEEEVIRPTNSFAFYSSAPEPEPVVENRQEPVAVNEASATPTPEPVVTEEKAVVPAQNIISYSAPVADDSISTDVVENEDDDAEDVVKPTVVVNYGFTSLQTEEEIEADRQRAEQNASIESATPERKTSFVIPESDWNLQKAKTAPVKAEPPVEAPKPVEPIVVTASKKYVLPDSSLLKDYDNTQILDELELKSREIGRQLNSFFGNYRIAANATDFDVGASVTCFHITMEPGVKMANIENVLPNLSVELGGNNSVRFIPVIPGKRFSGIEIGNSVTMTVPFKEIYNYMMKLDPKCEKKLLIPLGKDVFSEIKTVQLDKLPHLLVAGSTNSGKSVFIHSIILSIIMRTYPNEVKFLLIDPKKVEFAKYNDMPHLFCPIVTEADQAELALSKMVVEMDRRFELLRKSGVVNITEYYEFCKSHPSAERLPYIIVIIDEFADLMSTDLSGSSARDVARLAAKARAAGIHLIVATQRPSVSVISGDIKNNIAARVGLMVSSSTDSRTILDETGAEKLMGRGDLLAKIPGTKETMRCQSAYISDSEIRVVINYLKARAKPVYNPEFIDLNVSEVADDLSGPEGYKNVLERAKKDPLYPQAKKLVGEYHKASANFLKRMLSIPYDKASTFLDAMDDEGFTKHLDNGKRVVYSDIVDDDDDTTED